MNKEEIQTFRRMFSTYCRQEINKGRCTEDCCDFCSVNNAYDKLFGHTVDNEGDEAEDDNEI